MIFCLHGLHNHIIFIPHYPCLLASKALIKKRFFSPPTTEPDQMSREILEDCPQKIYKRGKA